jgi:hypothetical protein
MEPYAHLPQRRRIFGTKAPLLTITDLNFCGLLISYSTRLLTMIKIVLIAAISFARLNQ